MIEVFLYNSPNKEKKYRAIWFKNGEKIKHTDFGARGYEDYTIHKNAQQKKRYIKRHSSMNEDWNDPYSAGALSRWVLWEKPNLNDSWKFYKKKFDFK
jgi:hypothetical protein